MHPHNAPTTNQLFVGHAMTPSPYYYPSQHQPQFSVRGYYYNYPPPSPNGGGAFFASQPNVYSHHPNHNQRVHHPMMLPMHLHRMAVQQQQHFLQSTYNQTLNRDSPQQKKNNHRRRHNKTKCKFLFSSIYSKPSTFHINCSVVELKCIYWFCLK